MANSTTGGGRKAAADTKITVGELTVTVRDKVPFSVIRIVGDVSNGMTADKIDEFLRLMIGDEQTDKAWETLSLDEGIDLVGKILDATGIAGESSASPKA